MQKQQIVGQTTYQFTNADLKQINLMFVNLKKEGMKISEEEFCNYLRPFFKQGFRTYGTLEILNPLLDYLTHQFTMRETLLLNRHIRGLIHPTNEEIDQIINRLKENKEEYPILKLTIQSESESIECDTIIVIGGNNVGKDMFICNLINYIYKVDYYGLYRVNIQFTEQIDCNEYVVNYDKDKYIKIINCPVIGNIIQDQNNFINILKKISKLNSNTILGVFIINSACKTRLGIEEKYIIQRFFELFDKDYLKNIFLILTSSTDNSANTVIYLSENSPTPDKFKERIKNNTNIHRCFAFNNNCIYQIGKKDLKYPDYNDVLKENRIRGSNLNNDEQTNQSETESINSSRYDDIGNMYIQYWNKDCKTMEELINQINKIKENPQQLYNQYFFYMIQLEEQLNQYLNLFVMEQVDEFQSKIFQNRFYLQTNIISISSKGENVMGGTLALICQNCHIICHKSCQLINTENYHTLEKSKRCYKFDGKDEKNLSTDCQNCKKFNKDSKCKIENHQLLTYINIIELYQDSQPNQNQCTAKMLMDEYLIHKKLKREHQNKRLKYYKNQKEKETQKQLILKNIQKLKNQGLLDINLNTRLEFVEESIKIQSNDNQNKIEYIQCQKMYEYLIGKQEISRNEDFYVYEDLSPQRDNLRNSTVMNGQAPLIPSYQSHRKK